MNEKSMEELVRESGWMDALAFALVGQADLAEDIRQEALIIALQNDTKVPPSRAWLSGVIRNLALTVRRKTQSRQHRERQAAAGEQVESAAAAAAKVEQQQRLAQLVLGLREPYRTVVLLRFYDGLPQREIVRRLGRPSATINNQIYRGLALLREQLDREHGGDRRSWMLVLAPLVAGGSKHVAAATARRLLPGWTLAASTMLLVGGGWWSWSRHLDAASVPPQIASATEESDPAVISSAIPNEEVVARPKRQAEPNIAAAATFEVQVLRETGEPALGAEIYLYGDSRGEINDPNGGSAIIQATSQPSYPAWEYIRKITQVFAVDESGIAVLPWLGGNRQIMGKEGPASGAQRLPKARPQNRLTITLAAHALIPVRTLYSNGEPAAGIPVAIVRPQVTNRGHRVDHEDRMLGRAFTDSEGHATLELVPRFYDAKDTLRVELAFPTDERIYAVFDPKATMQPLVTLTCPPLGFVELQVINDQAKDYFELGFLQREGLGRPSHQLVLTEPIIDGHTRFWPVGVNAPVLASIRPHWGLRPMSVTGIGPSAAGSVRRLKIELEESLVWVKGRLVQEQRPLADVPIAVYPEAYEEFLTVRGDADGQFMMPMLRSVVEAGSGWRFHDAMSPPQSQGAQVIPTAEVVDGQYDLGDIEIPGTGPVLSGFVEDSSGSRCPNVTLLLVTEGQLAAGIADGGACFRSELGGQTDENGAFAIPYPKHRQPRMLVPLWGDQSASLAVPVRFDSKSVRIVVPAMSSLTRSSYRGSLA